jgi:DNA-directed RNA polymerase specialized sigma24 family protein
MLNIGGIQARSFYRRIGTSPKWTNEDDELLVTKFYQGESLAELAKYFQRKEGAIHSRLIRLLGESATRIPERRSLI